MGQEPIIALPDGMLELKSALETEWPQRLAVLHATRVPLNEGEGDGTGDGASGDGAGDGASGGDGTGEGDGGGDGDRTFTAEYVKNLRDEAAKHRREKADLAKKVKEFEDQGKSEKERLEERAAAAEQKAATAESAALRLEVALDKAPEGMPVAQVRKLAKRLAGATKEELEADAEELFADFAPANGAAGSNGTGSGRPRERLRTGATGATGADEEETDPAKLAAMVPRRYR